ncbi:MAG: hypothetical protein M5U12_05705 [Verrucomicrobia bacterium]|nr:hypothetical protein [Verrucomicrobiota bacterium]
MASCRLAGDAPRCLGLLAGRAAVEPVSVGNPSGRLEQVVIVFKTHFDIGYTEMASNVVQRYRTTMIDQALNVVDANRPLPPEQQFVWTLPGWPLHQILTDWDGQTTERQHRIQQAFREGRFVTHALPFTTHTEWLELEDLVRGLGYASTLSRDAGLALPRDAKMTDVPCHSWILPTLLRHAGVDFLHLGCNAASQSPQVPRLFWWEGPDGSRLLTMYTAESYGTGLVPPSDWPHRSWLALIHTGDNHGPPTPDEVGKLLAEARSKLPGVRVRIGRLSDFADAILAERPSLSVVRGDMPDTWIHGPMSDPQGPASLARSARRSPWRKRWTPCFPSGVSPLRPPATPPAGRTNRACSTANTPGAGRTGGSTASTLPTMATGGGRNGRRAASPASNPLGMSTRPISNPPPAWSRRSSRTNCRRLRKPWPSTVTGWWSSTPALAPHAGSRGRERVWHRLRHRLGHRRRRPTRRPPAGAHCPLRCYRRTASFLAFLGAPARLCHTPGRQFPSESEPSAQAGPVQRRAEQRWV